VRTFEQDTTPRRRLVLLTCDRCGRTEEPDSLEGQEFLLYADRGGYGSIFGDGVDVACDLCQHCVKDVLGAWLAIK